MSLKKNEEKRLKIAPFLEVTGISCLKDTVDSEFDVVVNACADVMAFSMGIVKAGKAGRLCFFSGITKNEHLETNLINALHYKELVVAGAYGLTRQNMVDGVPFMEKYQSCLTLLVEACLPPESIPGVMENVISGEDLKYIIDFTGIHLTCSPDSRGNEDQRDVKNVVGDTKERDTVNAVKIFSGTLWERFGHCRWENTESKYFCGCKRQP